MDVFGLTLTQIISIVGLFLLGLLVGILIRRLLSVALIILAIVILALALGYIHPSSIMAILQYAGYAASVAYSKAQQFMTIIPFSSIAFIIGLVIGLVKG